MHHIAFVTGTRAEFGLMRTALAAIRDHRVLTLQVVATGMHLDRRHGRTLSAIRADGWKVDAVVPWPGTARPAGLAANTGKAIARLALAFDKLRTDIVLVVGDRVEAFAAAAAGHLSQRIVAHVHGGDRALGQVDDALRHAITKLAHVHFPATPDSARRLLRLGEDRWRIHTIGSPGVDGIAAAAASRDSLPAQFPGLLPGRYALLVLHPADAEEPIEHARAQAVLKAIRSAGIEQVVIVYPNNDPGSGGIIRAWKSAGDRPGRFVRPNVSRELFLGLMRDAGLMVGNSSAGIIEAASFGTPVLDIGPRQTGRQASGNVRHAGYGAAELAARLTQLWNRGRPRRWRGQNVYGGDGAGQRMAEVLAGLTIDERLRRKLIAY